MKEHCGACDRIVLSDAGQCLECGAELAEYRHDKDECKLCRRLDERMECELVFHDWIKGGKSIYQTEEGVGLSTGDFHSGSTFPGEIELDEEQTQELKDAIDKGYSPVFYIVQKKRV